MLTPVLLIVPIKLAYVKIALAVITIVALMAAIKWVRDDDAKHGIG